MALTCMQLLALATAAMMCSRAGAANNFVHGRGVIDVRTLYDTNTMNRFPMLVNEDDVSGACRTADKGVAKIGNFVQSQCKTGRKSNGVSLEDCLDGKIAACVADSSSLAYEVTEQFWKNPKTKERVLVGLEFECHTEPLVRVSTKKFGKNKKCYIFPSTATYQAEDFPAGSTLGYGGVLLLPSGATLTLDGTTTLADGTVVTAASAATLSASGAVTLSDGSSVSAGTGLLTPATTVKPTTTDAQTTTTPTTAKPTTTAVAPTTYVSTSPAPADGSTTTSAEPETTFVLTTPASVAKRTLVDISDVVVEEKKEISAAAAVAVEDSVPAAEAPATDAPATNTPATNAPATEVPTTDAPTTKATPEATSEATPKATSYSVKDGCCASDAAEYDGDHLQVNLGLGKSGDCETMCTAMTACLAFELKTNTWKGGLTTGYTCEIHYTAQPKTKNGRNCKRYQCAAKTGGAVASRVAHEGEGGGAVSGAGADSDAPDFVTPVAAAAGVVVAASILVAAYLRLRPSQPRLEHDAEPATAAAHCDGMAWDGADLEVLSAVGAVRTTEV